MHGSNRQVTKHTSAASTYRVAALTLLVGLLCGQAIVAQPALAQDARIEKAERLFLEGQQAYQAGRLDEAVAKLRQAYAMTKAPELAFNVARVLERMGEADASIRFFRLYLKRGEPDAKERESIEKRIEALKAIRKRQREQIMTAPPSDDELTAEARSFFLRGVAMFKRERFRAAMVAFTAAHQFAPLPEVIYNLAVTSERLGKLRDAIDYYREYLRSERSLPDRALVERKLRALQKKRDS